MAAQGSSSIGCYSLTSDWDFDDSTSDRRFLTLETCAQRCLRQSLAVFGVSTLECGCAKFLPGGMERVSTSRCTTACPSNSSLPACGDSATTFAFHWVNYTSNELITSGITSTLPASDPTSTPLPASSSSSGKLPVWIPAVIASIAFVLLIVTGVAIFCCVRRRRRRTQSGSDDEEDVEKTTWARDEVTARGTPSPAAMKGEMEVTDVGSADGEGSGTARSRNRLKKKSRPNLETGDGGGPSNRRPKSSTISGHSSLHHSSEEFERYGPSGGAADDDGNADSPPDQMVGTSRSRHPSESGSVRRRSTLLPAYLSASTRPAKPRAQVQRDRHGTGEDEDEPEFVDGQPLRSRRYNEHTVLGASLSQRPRMQQTASDPGHSSALEMEPYRGTTGATPIGLPSATPPQALDQRPLPLPPPPSAYRSVRGRVRFLHRRSQSQNVGVHPKAWTVESPRPLSTANADYFSSHSHYPPNDTSPPPPLPQALPLSTIENQGSDLRYPPGAWSAQPARPTHGNRRSRTWHTPREMTDQSDVSIVQFLDPSQAHGGPSYYGASASSQHSHEHSLQNSTHSTPPGSPELPLLSHGAALGRAATLGGRRARTGEGRDDVPPAPTGGPSLLFEGRTVPPFEPRLAPPPLDVQDSRPNSSWGSGSPMYDQQSLAASAYYNAYPRPLPSAATPISVYSQASGLPSPERPPLRSGDTTPRPLSATGLSVGNPAAFVEGYAYPTFPIPYYRQEQDLRDLLPPPPGPQSPEHEDLYLQSEHLDQPHEMNRAAATSTPTSMMHPIAGMNLRRQNSVGSFGSSVVMPVGGNGALWVTNPDVAPSRSPHPSVGSSDQSPIGRPSIASAEHFPRLRAGGHSDGTQYQ